MSKSDPASAIFMDDSAAEVAAKLRSAFCPPGQTAGNPVLDYCRHIVFAAGDSIVIESGPGGAVAGAAATAAATTSATTSVSATTRTFASYAELETAYAAGAVHPADLKPALAAALNRLLEPVRAHFAANPDAAQLAEAVRGMATTR